MADEHGPEASVADAIADNRAIDWEHADHRRRSTDHDLVEQLKIIAAIAKQPPRAVAQTAQDAGLGFFAMAYGAAVALAGLKDLFGLIGAIRGPALLDSPIVGPSLLNVVLFGGCGLVLIIGGSGDRRVQSLGSVFVFIAAAFADPLLGAATRGPLGAIARALRSCPPESFFALAFWRFARAFPRASLRRHSRTVGNLFVAASGALGVLLVAANVALAAAGPALPRALGWLTLLDRHAPTGAFWPLMLGSVLPALVYLIWNARFEPIEEKRRATWFVTALVAGLSPMMLVVVVSPWMPWLASPGRRQVVGVVLYVALAAIVPMTMYAVTVHRVMTARLIIRKTMQYRVARMTVTISTIGSFLYLLVLVYLHRDQTVTEFLSRGSISALLSAVVVSAFLFRRQLLSAVDRWFLREAADPTEVLARLDRGFRATRSVREVIGLLTQEIDRTLHPSGVAALIVNSDGTQLASMAAAVPPLDTNSALVDLLQSARTEIQLDVREDGPVMRLLQPEDRRWLLDGRFQLLSPLNASHGHLLGMIAVAERRNQLPYDRNDRALLAALSGHAAMWIENQQLRGGPAVAAHEPRHLNAIDWHNEPGVYCLDCLRVSSLGNRVCSCGGKTVTAVLPPVVNGKFRVERFIGAGGMGVVYEGVDVALDRRVAIKTLPALTARHVTLLEREARTMAAVAHPNLALIYSVERWRQTPLLIVEYLEGGTLADRLRSGPLRIPSALELGVVLADVVDRLHTSGVLHLDIKPSNVGYTREHVPKLLDFGLAGIHDGTVGDQVRVDVSELCAAVSGASSRSTSILLSTGAGGGLVGTPLYLSPEAVAGHTPSPLFDLWSLALLIYEAIAGRLPLSSDLTAAEVLARIPRHGVPDVREFRPDCPADIAAFLRGALAPTPAARPQTAAAFRTHLQRLRADHRAS